MTSIVGLTIRRTTRFWTSRIARAADQGNTVAPRPALMALTSLRLAEIDVLCEISEAGRRSHLETLLTRLHTDLPALSDAMTHHYLSHAESSRHLAASALARAQ